MGDNRFGLARRTTATAIATIAVACAPVAAADPPRYAMCDNPAYSSSHPLDCDQNRGGAGPPGTLPGGGGPGSGGLLGLIHRLTGGLL